MKTRNSQHRLALGQQCLVNNSRPKARLALGQASIEFAFAMIIVLLIVYGLIMVFRWVGVTYAERRYKQQESLTKAATEEEQLNNYNNAGYRPRHLGAVYQGNMYGN